MLTITRFDHFCQPSVRKTGKSGNHWIVIGGVPFREPPGDHAGVLHDEFSPVKNPIDGGPTVYSGELVMRADEGWAEGIAEGRASVVFCGGELRKAPAVGSAVEIAHDHDRTHCGMFSQSLTNQSGAAYLHLGVKIEMRIHQNRLAVVIVEYAHGALARPMAAFKTAGNIGGGA